MTGVECRVEGVFLSHSHKDKDLIEPEVAFLRSHGVKIYVDWMDEGMPDTVSGETAKMSTLMILSCRNFVTASICASSWYANGNAVFAAGNR